jgi:hypothetical protein
MSTATATPVTGKAKPNRFNGLKKGTVLSETQYYTVEQTEGIYVHLKTDNGEDITVNADYINNHVNVADQYDTEEIKSRTEVIQIFLAHPYTAMTVNFNKKVDPKEVAKEIEEAYLNSTPRDASTKMRQALNRALEGTERTMIGRHHGHHDEFGRVSFVDMQIARNTSANTDTRLRLVDPRTINWLIVKGVKYKVK